LARHSPQLVESHIASCSCRRRAWQGSAGDEDILPDKPSTCCKIYQEGHCRSHRLCREGASDTQLRSVASHRRVFLRYRATLRYRTAQWLSRSSRSSISCRMSRARIFRTASHSAPCSAGGLPDPYFCRYSHASTGNHTHLQFPGFFLPRPDRLGSRTARVPQTRTPNSDHSTERRPRPWSLLSRGRPAGSVRLLP